VPHRTLTATEIARYLHLPLQSVQTLIKRQEIPFEMRGETVVFRKHSVDAWASQRILGMGVKSLADYHRTSSATVHDLSQRRALMPELIRAAWIAPALRSRTKPGTLRDMAALAGQTGLVYDEAGLLASLKEREQLCSTAIGSGVALLHPRHHEPYMFEDSFICLGRTIQPIHADAQDGKPTDLFFLICCQDDSIHLHTLARICSMGQIAGFLNSLRAAESADTMLKAIFAAEMELISRL
jgi:excisionase family DNA binding protein